MTTAGRERSATAAARLSRDGVDDGHLADRAVLRDRGPLRGQGREPTDLDRRCARLGVFHLCAGGVQPRRQGPLADRQDRSACCWPAPSRWSASSSSTSRPKTSRRSSTCSAARCARPADTQRRQQHASARPRCDAASFSAELSCAAVRSSPVRDKHRVVAEARRRRAAARRSRRATRRARRPRRDARHQRTRRHECRAATLVGHVAHLRQQQRGVGGIVAVACPTTARTTRRACRSARPPPARSRRPR